MLQLQELHVPLHVAERPAAELEVTRRIGGLGQPLGLHPGLDALDLTDGLVGDLRRVAHLVGERLERFEHAGVAGDRARAQEGLGLPGQRPALIVGTVRLERTHDRAVLALGPQTDVEVERDAQVFGEPRERVHDLLGALLRLLVGRPGGAIHVHDVGIRPEAQLRSPIATHGDDAELDPVPETVGDREGSGKHSGRDVRQRITQLIDRDDAEDGAESQSQHLTTAGGAQGKSGGILIAIVASHDRLSLVEKHGEGSGAQLLVVLQPGRGLRDALEEIAHEARTREHLS